MPHAVLANQLPTSTLDGFFGYWRSTRAMLAAGWKYKASGDATATGTKDTGGSFINEKWGVGGGVALNATVQSATGSVVMTAATDGTVTLTFTGTAFTALSVGRMLTISGAANSTNNGTFRITTFTSGTSIKIFNPNTTTETTSVTWTEKQGGSNGTISTAGTGAATRGRAIFTVSSGTPFVVPVASPLNRGSVGDRLTISNGAVGANNGHFVITRVTSTTTVEIENSAATSSGETNNGSLNWTEVSPTAQVEPASITATNGTGAWICLQGPSIMKIPIGTNVPTGTFLRGEKVTATTSGATGTVIGVLTDTSGGLGYLVIEPRLNGSGGGPRGWTSGSTDTVTGAQSAATITSSTGAPVEYVVEMVIWKNTQVAGHMWFQVVDQSGESASRFSVLATGGSVSNTVAPGGVAATFPTPGSWVVSGTANSGAAGTGSINWYNSTTVTHGLSQIMCANCIETATEGADGSWIVATGQPTISNSAYHGTGFLRMDDSEDGDLAPFVTFGPQAIAIYAGSRTAATTVSTTNDYFRPGTWIVGTGTVTPYRSFRRRGFSTGDAFQEYLGTMLTVFNNSAIAPTNPGNPGKIANHVNPSVFIREPIWVISTQLSLKQRKGTPRWLFLSEGGVSGQMYGSGAYLQLGSALGEAGIAGPWDGASSATQA